MARVDDWSRYRRQTAFAPLGEEGQRRLQRSRLLVVGCGALGGTIADLLVRSGFGVDDGLVTIIDPDVVRADNLHRQMLFTERDAAEARYKVVAARDALKAVNGKAKIEAIVGRFDENNASMLESFDLLLDATDRFRVRFVMNRAAVRFGKPWITAGVLGASGQILTILPGETPCLECLFDPETIPDERFDTEHLGILPPLPRVLASLQVMEAIKILSGRLEAVNRSLWSFDFWNNRITTLEAARNGRCTLCGSAPSNDDECPI